MKKYELTNQTISVDNRTLYRIRAVKSFKTKRIFGNVKNGDLGGYIETESNLSQEGNCWVFDNAKVFDDALVSDNAWVSDDAQIHGSACISGDAIVFTEAKVYGKAQVSGHAQIYDKAKISGNAQVYGCALVFKNAWVHDNAQVYGCAQVFRDANVYDNAKVYGRAYINSNVNGATINISNLSVKEIVSLAQKLTKVCISLSIKHKKRIINLLETHGYVPMTN